MESADRTLHLQATPPGVAPPGIVVSLSGRRLTGPDPVRSCAARLPARVEPQTLVLVFSPLLGYGISSLLDRLPHACAVLMVEFEPVLIPLADRTENVVRDLRSTRLRFASTTFEAQREIDGLVRRFALRRVVSVSLTGGARFQTEKYRELTDAAERIVQRFWFNRGTQIRLARRWIGNLMRNTSLPAVPPGSLSGVTGRTVLLIGAGPDLDARLAWVASLKGAVPVVALDTALPALAEARIQPDYLVSMDSQVANAYDMLPWRWDAVTLIADVTVHPSIPRRFPAERRAFFASRFADLELFREKSLQELFAGTPVLPPRGSVAPAAIEVLVRILDVRTIVTIGIDFWYRSPHSHALMTSPDRRFRATTHRLGRNDGFPELLARPHVESRLRTGATVSADAILDDHAQQTRRLLEELAPAFPSLLVCTINPLGLETGAAVITTEEARRILLADTPAPDGEDATVSAAAPEEGGHGRAAVEAPAWSAGVSPGNDGYHERRVYALRSLLERLRTQEQVLAASPDHSTARPAARTTAEGGNESGAPPIFLDSGLEFVLLDFPQWPLMTTRQAWAQLHRQRILESVRDYRRRLERALLANATPRENP